MFVADRSAACRRYRRCGRRLDFDVSPDKPRVAAIHTSSRRRVATATSPPDLPALSPSRDSCRRGTHASPPGAKSKSPRHHCVAEARPHCRRRHFRPRRRSGLRCGVLEYTGGRVKPERRQGTCLELRATRVTRRLGDKGRHSASNRRHPRQRVATPGIESATNVRPSGDQCCRRRRSTHRPRRHRVRVVGDQNERRGDIEHEWSSVVFPILGIRGDWTVSAATGKAKERRLDWDS